MIPKANIQIEGLKRDKQNLSYFIYKKNNNTQSEPNMYAVIELSIGIGGRGQNINTGRKKILVFMP